MTRIALALLVLLAPTAVPAQEGDGREDSDRVRLFGDFRLRLEQDWDSLRGDGTERDDRLRLRVRLRAGAELRLGDHFTALVRARSGSDLSQQSPHITVHDFDDGPDGPYEANLDRWLVSYSSGGFEAWAGRNELSFWHHDDLFINDNVTYTGAGGSYRRDMGPWISLTLSANYVALPVGMRDDSGTAFIGQLAYDCSFEGSGFTVAAGYWDSDAEPDDPAGEILLTGNGSRDYRVLDLQLQYRTRIFGTLFWIGYDYMRNLEDYSRAPAGSFSAFHEDDVSGWLVEVLWGDDEEPGDWLLGYYYTRLEALSVHSSYIADDWVRWGNADQVRATNLRGSELRIVYTLTRRMNLYARAFFVDAIGFLEPGDTTRETGNRLRIDWNVRF